jgi:hypothetical protein
VAIIWEDSFGIVQASNISPFLGYTAQPESLKHIDIVIY